MAAPLQNAMSFLRDFGFFDVVLPFLLVFAIMYAILEKTKILGDEAKQLNAVVAFVVGLLVAGTNRVTSIINEALPNLVVLVVGILGFLILVGMFYKEGKFDFAKDYAKTTAAFAAILFIGILAIFFNSIKTESGKSWLETILQYLFNNASGTVVTSLIFLVIVIGAIGFIMGWSPEKKKTTDPNNSGGGGE